MKGITALIVLLFLLNSCQKDGKGCWQAFDPLGADVTGLVLCEKTKAEAEAAYPNYWFYRAGEKKYCWRMQIGNTVHNTWGVPESMVQRYKEYNGTYQFTKIDCNSFCTIEWLEKHKSKITNQYGFTRLVVDTQLPGDSCSKLFVGKIVVVRETTDSLITREVSKKFP